MKKDSNEYPWNLLHDCGITERKKLPKDIEGVIRYLLYGRKTPYAKRNADIVIDYYNGLSQSEIGVKYGITRQRVFTILKTQLQYLSQEENRILLADGIFRG